MNISKFKLAVKYLFGGIGSVVDYLLDILNQALAKVDPGRKEQTQAALNIALRVLSTLKAFEWLCPTKWQSAYAKTLAAVERTVTAFDDFILTADEFAALKDAFASAVSAWKSPDDDTCVDCIED